MKFQKQYSVINFRRPECDGQSYFSSRIGLPRDFQDYLQWITTLDLKN